MGDFIGNLRGVAGVAAIAVVLAAPAGAQTAGTSGAGGSTAGASVAAGGTASLEDLLKTIEDDAGRKKFAARLRALIAAQKATRGAAGAAKAGVESGNGKGAPPEGEGTFIASIMQKISAASRGVAEGAALVVEVPIAWTWMKAQFTQKEARQRWIEAGWKVGLIFLCAYLAEWLARLLLYRPRRAVEDREGDPFIVKAAFLVLRTVMDLIPIVAFAVTAYAILPYIEPSELVGDVALMIIYANVLYRMIKAISRMAFVPKAAGLRLLPISDETAVYAFVWINRIAGIAIYGFFTAEALDVLGLPKAGYDMIVKVVGLMVAMMVITVILQNRRNVAEWMAGTGDDGEVREGVRARLGALWHIPSILYVAASFLVWAVDIENGWEFLLRATLLTLVVLLGAGLLMYAIRRGVDRLFDVSEELEAEYPGIEARANRYLPLSKNVLQGVIVLMAACAILQAWNIEVLAWLTSGPGRNFVASIISVAIVALVALIVWEGVSAIIERYLAAAEDDDADPERAERLRTLLPLARRVLFFLLCLFVLLITLSEFGVDIAPLVAGAGVIGLAIGFGAQTLVKDVITGLFILLEDTVSVGDVVELAGHSGVVQSLTIRSLRLRDYSGTVHTIPFSSVETVKNMSKDFSYAVIEAGVSYRENVDEVMTILQAIGNVLYEDKSLGADVLSPFEIAGVSELGESAVVIKGRMKTTPGNQFGVEREFNRLMKVYFDERGIEIPYPHITMYFGQDKDGKAPPVNVRSQAVVGEDRTSAAPSGRKKTAFKPLVSVSHRQPKDEKGRTVFTSDD